MSKIISFGDKKYDKIKINNFPIIYENDRCDFYKTLNQISEIKENVIIYLEEEIQGDPRLGIKLLIRIRLAYFFLKEKALVPIFIKLNSNIEDLVKSNILYSIVLSDGINIIKSFDELNQEHCITLFKDNYKKLLDSLTIKELSNEDPHNLANEWGAFRLKLGFIGLINHAQIFKETEYKFFPNNLNRLFYWYILCNETLEVSSKDFEFQYSKKVLNEWRNLKLNELKSLQVAYIDDEANKGWSEILSVLFSEMLKLDVNFICYVPNEENFNEIEKEVLEKQFHLMLIDLRLLEKDSSRNSFKDEISLPELTGIKLIKSIKDKYPNAGIIAFTASNKSWTSRYLLDEEGIIDGYWIKENPIRNTSINYSIKNTENLLRQILSVLKKKNRYNKLWDLIEKLSDEKFLVERFKGVKKKNFIPSIVRTAKSLLTIAFGMLDQNITTFRREKFNFNPNEMGFIYIWGCLHNELFPIRINSWENLFLDKDGKVKYYAQFDHEKKIRNYEDFVRELVVQHNYKKFNDNLDNYIDGILRSETDLIWLMFASEYPELVSVYGSLREKRNQLNFIHGEKGKSQLESEQPQIQINDINSLIKIINTYLFIDK